jgi:hypothetical protein
LIAQKECALYIKLKETRLINGIMEFSYPAKLVRNRYKDTSQRNAYTVFSLVIVIISLRIKVSMAYAAQVDFLPSTVRRQGNN